jgi:methionine synthase II (cobalamin-independent)
MPLTQEPLWAVSFWGHNIHIELHFKTVERARKVLSDFVNTAKNPHAIQMPDDVAIRPVLCYYEDDFGQEVMVSYPFFFAAKMVNIWDYNERSKMIGDAVKEIHKSTKVGFGA